MKSKTDPHSDRSTTGGLLNAQQMKHSHTGNGHRYVKPMASAGKQPSPANFPRDFASGHRDLSICPNCCALPWVQQSAKGPW